MMTDRMMQAALLVAQKRKARLDKATYMRELRTRFREAGTQNNELVRHIGRISFIVGENPTANNLYAQAQGYREFGQSDVPDYRTADDYAWCGLEDAALYAREEATARARTYYDAARLVREN